MAPGYSLDYMTIDPSDQSLQKMNGCDSIMIHACVKDIVEGRRAPIIKIFTLYSIE